MSIHRNTAWNMAIALRQLCFLALASIFCTSPAWWLQSGFAEDAEDKVVELPVIALRGGRVVTLSDAGQLDAATVIIRGDKIEAVGTDLEIPEGARIIDVAGAVVSPGLIDLRSKLWMTGQAAGDTGSTAAMNAIDGVDPFNRDWREVARQGVTAVYLQPAASGTLGGYGVLLRVAEGDGSVDSLVIESTAGFQSSLGVSSGSVSSKARLAEFNGLKKRLEEAKSYKEAWEKYREYEAEQAKQKATKDNGKKEKGKEGKDSDPAKDKPAEKPEKSDADTDKAEQPRTGGRRISGRGGVRRGGVAGTPDKPEQPAEEDKKSDDDKKPADKNSDDKKEAPKKPKFEQLKENLIQVLAGEVPLRLEVHRGDDLRRALEIAKEFKISLVLDGLSDIGSAGDALLETGLPIVLGPWSDDARASYQSVERVANWSEQFADYPGRLAIASFASSGRASKALRFDAAQAIAAGFDHQRVLAAITSVPAELVGAGDRLGKIKAGYQADLAVFAGEPLDPTTRVLFTISAGEVVYEAGQATTSAASEEPAATALKIVAEHPLPAALPTTYGIRSQRILQADGQFAAGYVTISDGKITASEVSETNPEGLTIYDLGEAVLTPGLVSAHALLTPSSLSDEQNVVDSAAVRAADVYDPRAAAVKRLIAGGFLRVGHAPADQRVMAGPLAEVRLGATEPVITKVIAEKIVLSGGARSRERFPASLAGQQQLVRQSIAVGGEPLPLFLPAAALAVFDQARSSRSESLSSGARPTLMQVETEGEIIAAMKLVKELGLQATLLGPDDLQATKDALAAAGIGVLVRPMRTVDFDWYATDLAEAAGAGVPLGFAGTDPLEIRRTAAALVQAGVPTATALQGLTTTGAALVGMQPGAGKLVAGEHADIVIWSASPLQLAARPLAVIIDGKLAQTED
ncbi:amidohydrolase family protein [Planctomycetaceae bacterium SH139]